MVLELGADALPPESKSKALEEATALCRKAVELDPSWDSAWNDISAGCSGLDRDLEAEEAASKAIELRPLNASAFYNRACARRRLGRLDEAREDCKRAIEIKPGWEMYDDLPRAIDEGRRDDH